MRVPLEWLHDFCSPALPVRELATRLAMTGTEVERIHRHGVDALEFFVVGRVLAAERHPDADRLSVCRVSVGEGDVAQIVCGAPNVAADQTVAVAQPGAIMPDGTRLGTAKLRGVDSAGMILAEDELGIGTDHGGIMVLDDLLVPEEDEADAIVPGTPLQDVLPGIATDVLELEITPNRPDCLGVYGVAREVHAATGAPLTPPPWTEGLSPGWGCEVDGVRIEVRDPDLCPRFTAVAYDDVTIAPSPPWLKARLMAAGQRPISNVVDITNYAMLLTGQPLHAFDLDRVAGGALTVRRATEGEEVTTLDGQVRRLDGEMVLIEDADGPTSIAGVMGGERSEVREGTTRVLMEVATWDGPNIHRTAQLLDLRSEASSRFEKGLAPEQAVEAQAVAHRLMVDLCGATPRPALIDVGGAGRAGTQSAVIELRARTVERLLGQAVATERQEVILRALGFGVEAAADALLVTVPSFRRHDVTREADLVEEVARIDGLERLPATLPARRGAAGMLDRPQRLRRRAEDVLVGRGLHEVVGWSFTSRELLDRLRLPADSPLREVVELLNPMSEAQAVLRPTILGSLLDAARHNAAHGQRDLALFESGAVYRAAGDPPTGSVGGLPHEHHALAVLLQGALARATWGTPQPPRAGFFAAKGLLAAVLHALRVEWQVTPAQEPYLHPGRSAAVLVAGERVGWLGEVHPLVTRSWELDDPVASFAVDLGRVIAAAPAAERYEDVTSHPAVRQDLAVVLPADVPAERVLAVTRGAGGTLLTHTEVFDVYEGEQVGEGRRSLALHLEFRAPDRTLTDEDADRARGKIVAALGDELEAVQRG
ncbi:MAG: phenylalanine--tRNA ligase subunit beta [Solirubrobacteraceae bacterium MAG38_C4-C5]|nr:phenylalanine--tRNA ligase subunit beta [Candidatus Siliceabacter maunaloa]